MDKMTELAMKYFRVPADQVTTKQRAFMKTLVFAKTYGAGPAKIQEMCNLQKLPARLTQNYRNN